MPIRIPDDLPAKEILNSENIFVMIEDRAYHQDIRPLRILIVNLMPTKRTTETQLLRLLGNSPLQVDITLLKMKSHKVKNTPMEHMIKFYTHFENIKHEKFDGMIVTGAPVELLEYEEVNYWDELCTIMEWANANVQSTMYVCWGAQAGLNYHYGIDKYGIDAKKFGVFRHKVVQEKTDLLRGFDDLFYMPHSRNTEIRKEDVEKIDDLVILAEAEDGDLGIIANRDRSRIFIIGHPEYDPYTLKKEYVRDVTKGLDIAVPVNYFEDDNPDKEPIDRWRAHANLLYMNWLNYYVYQKTPFDWN